MHSATRRLSDGPPPTRISCYTEHVTVFALTVPATAVRPLLVEVPHAGLSLPDDVRDQLEVPEATLIRDADIFVDRLYESAPKFGATLLVAKHSRYVVDLNRAHDDLDAATVSGHPTAAGAQPRGVVWRCTTEGRAVLARPLTYAELVSRLTRYYVPYHAALKQTLEEFRKRFGYAVILAGHSMPSMGRSLHKDPGARRADVVPGTCGRTTADRRIIDLVDAHFRSAGLTVRHDDPYKGGFTTSHYGRPREGVHAIQIELNRSLYVDEQTCTQKPREFQALQQLLDALVAKLAAIDPRA